MRPTPTPTPSPAVEERKRPLLRKLPASSEADQFSAALRAASGVGVSTLGIFGWNVTVVPGAWLAPVARVHGYRVEFETPSKSNQRSEFTVSRVYGKDNGKGNNDREKNDEAGHDGGALALHGGSGGSSSSARAHSDTQRSKDDRVFDRKGDTVESYLESIAAIGTWHTGFNRQNLRRGPPNAKAPVAATGTIVIPNDGPARTNVVHSSGTGLAFGSNGKPEPFDRLAGVSPRHRLVLKG